MKRVFISYPREKADSARRLFTELLAVEGVKPWLDEYSLLPGLKWEPAIKKEIGETDYVLALLSCDSTETEGYQHVELDEALARLRRFPENRVFLIPARLDDCKMPRHELDSLNRLDLFPKWSRGIERLLSVLVPDVNASDGTSPRESKLNGRPRYHYRVALADLDLGLTNLKSIAEAMNAAQRFFLFTCPAMPSLRTAVGKIPGITNLTHLKVHEIPSSFFLEHAKLAVDFVVCLTGYPLAIDEGNRFLLNYFAGPSDEDERFLFVSTDQLYTFCKQADRTLEEGLVHIIVGQLMAYFTEIGYHDETRGCVMDLCELRADQVSGLKSRKFCDECNQGLPQGDLRTAIEALLALDY